MLTIDFLPFSTVLKYFCSHWSLTSSESDNVVFFLPCLSTWNRSYHVEGKDAEGKSWKYFGSKGDSH